MKKNPVVLLFACISAMTLFFQCADTSNDQQTPTTDSVTRNDFGGFGSAEKWGEHLVHIAACHDCHTPKKMTDHGPDMDWDLMLSGHPANAPEPQVSRQEMESKGLAVTGKILEHVKADKVLIFKKKRRKGYRKTIGHRQSLTKVQIEKIG